MTTRTTRARQSSGSGTSTAAAAAASTAAAAAPAPAAPASSSKQSVSMSLLTVTDAEDPSQQYQFLVRWRAPLLTLTVLAVPNEMDPSSGWIRHFDGELKDSLQPADLAKTYRIGWSDRVHAGLSGRSAAADLHSIIITELSADSSLHPSKRRSELRLVYKTHHTLVRLTLSPQELATGGSHHTSTRPVDSMKQFRDAALHMIRQANDLLTASQARVTERQAKVDTNAAAMQERLNALQDRAMRKAFTEEALYAWFSRILEAKDKELDRVAAERESLVREREALLVKRQMEASPSLAGSLHLSASSGKLTADDLRSLARPVDDEGDSGDSARDNDSASDNEDAPMSDADAKKSKKTKATAKAKPAARASAAKPRAKKATAAAAAAASPDAPKAKASRKAAPSAKGRAKKSIVEASDDEADSKASSKKSKRTKKRARSPSPIDEEFALSEAEDGAAAAIAAVSAFEEDQRKATAAAAAKAKVKAKAVAAAAAAAASPPKEEEGREASDEDLEVVLPLPARRVPSTRRTERRPPTPHASPKEESPVASLASIPPPLPMASDSRSSSLDQSPRKKRRASPPPRVLPKKSLAEILRSGAEGLDASETPDEEPEQRRIERIATPGPTAKTRTKHATAPRSSPRPPSSAASLGVAPMDMSSQ